MTSICYLEQNDCYLMLHRVKKENDLNHDKWIGVGGKFEHGESPEECVCREVLEETGLTLTDFQFRGLITFDIPDQETEYMHLFTATGFLGTMSDCDEGILEWIPKKEIFSLPIWEGDRIFLHLIAEEAPFFSLKLTYYQGQLSKAILNGKPLSI